MANRPKINECDKYVYVKSNENDYAIVCLYVDDMLIIDNNINIIKATKQMLANKFEMKDMGVANVILDIIISRTSQELVSNLSPSTCLLGPRRRVKSIDITHFKNDTN